MELHFLGTGAGVPSKQRNTTAIALKFLNDYKGALWLFDCGEATQHQMLYTSLKLSKLERIFITHLHGDHIYGLPGVLGSRSFQGGKSPLTVYGPKGIDKFIKATLSISETHLHYPLKVVEVEDGMSIDLKSHTVTVKELEHAIQSFGYRMKEKKKPGSLLVDRLKEIGVKPGPAYAALKKGERVTLDDGRILNGEDFVGPKKPGKTVVILGDTRVCKNAEVLAENADILVHEATFMESDRKIAYEYFHSTTVDAARIANRANVSKLILTHISSRYQGEQSNLLLKEARKVFKNTFLASDLDIFTF
ncbi:ribonuclease Z [Pueribacillus theae]|uniref:Ribonuclease Z n=1 Tax=Pueribacillus theae TaxID=2171751 RepID=A0A2U1K7I3_9BACI|nr:ribonuclease Z [Pueribacillus theae]PWA13184.1 ribonuclease Z [Pueribacillus theae]